MKRLEELNFYEILEVSPGASQAEIRKAYEQAKRTYHVDSIAMYSLLDEREIQEVARLVEEAYHTIGNEKGREEYDRMLGIAGGHRAPVSHSRAGHFSESVQTLGLMTLGSQQPEQWQKVEDMISREGFEYTGLALREIRETLGLELGEISERTKVSRTNLQFLEEENYARLPALVYLRGFVNEYARCLGLDVTRVLEDYVRRYRAWEAHREM
jgi:curved DNA-binding protein CbpA